MHTVRMKSKTSKDEGRSRRAAGVWPACLVGILSLTASGPLAAGDAVAELRQAATTYTNAFRTSDAAALADQWTERATLVEGNVPIEGRVAIVASLLGWRRQHPDGVLEVEVGDIDLIAEPVARVSGVIRFTPKPGEKPILSRFTSLRVREGTTWRIAESIVESEHAAALDDLDWLIGTWTATGGAEANGAKATVDIVYEKPLGDFCIVGRTRYQPADGPPITALEVIHADRESGRVRSWVFDSTGARAEGVVESDGTTFHKTMVGTPSEGARGSVARWVQVIAPTGEGRCTVHSIERSIDDAPVPDGEPLHFQKASGR